MALAFRFLLFYDATMALAFRFSLFCDATTDSEGFCLCARDDTYHVHGDVLDELELRELVRALVGRGRFGLDRRGHGVGHFLVAGHVQGLDMGPLPLRILHFLNRPFHLKIRHALKIARGKKCLLLLTIIFSIFIHPRPNSKYTLSHNIHAGQEKNAVDITAGY